MSQEVEAKASPRPAPPPERVAAVQRARDRWVADLIDESRRNNLLYFVPRERATLELTDCDPGGLHALLAGKPVSLARLFPEAQRKQALAVLKEMHWRARANWEEKGLQTLFLAVGLATWPADDGGRDPAAPVVLVPVRLETQGHAHPVIAWNGDPQWNLVLVHVLQSRFGVQLDPEEEIPLGAEAGEGTAPEGASPAEENGPAAAESEGTATGARWLEAIAQSLRDRCAGIQGFAVQHRVVLGNFAFQKMAMVQDLQDHLDAMVANDLVAAVAGYEPARLAVAAAGAADPALADPARFDAVPPDQEFLILDADSSQQAAIHHVLAGRNVVIQGPPGTGKSQTIVNLIASLVAQGKRVLFVAEKRAALEVVKRRLEREGLGHLVLDLHGADLSRREIMARVAQALDRVRQVPAVDPHPLHSRFVAERQRLVAHRDRLHRPRAPSGLSVYQLQGEILQLPPGAETALRWRGQRLAALTAEAAGQICDLLREAGAHADLFLGVHPSPWNLAALRSAADVQQAQELVDRLAVELLPQMEEHLQELAARAGVQPPSDAAGLLELAEALAGAQRILSLYDPAVFAQDLDALVAALAPAGRGPLAALWAYLTQSKFRAALAQARRFRHAGPARALEVLGELTEARALLARWRRLATAPHPLPLPGLGAVGTLLQEFHASLQRLAPYVPALDLLRLEFAPLAAALRALAADRTTPSQVWHLHRIEEQLNQWGLALLLAEIRKERLPADLWPQRFRYAWLQSCLEQALMEEPELAAFRGRAHDQAVAVFQQTDVERLKLASQRLQAIHADRVVAALNQHPRQADLVRREAAKRSRHKPLRQLLAEAPDVLTALFPCWMASPLSVSQLIGADRTYFDVVIFDEASQVPPSDAIPALMRARQLVVAGDVHQLPPTPFFADGPAEAEGQGDGDEATAGYESILDVVQPFLHHCMLVWHYRSLDERLIAFANRHIYNDQLITFPGVGGEPALRHVLVEAGEGSGPEESATAEVEQVVELVRDHARRRPHETLGVIAMGYTHARRIEALLDKVREEDPDLEAFLQAHPHEPFFVKNLERVQGDERDAIILTIGYGKRSGGRVLLHFGPLLNRIYGHRRLNVAITRARRRMTVVSSFTDHELDVHRSDARGLKMLKDFLAYARTGGRTLGEGAPTGAPLNAFEADVKAALEAAGVPCVAQLGVSRYRIDLAALHPVRPGRYVLAIECDGATYHSLPTARERDRLRQRHLEALGWRFHRIWSTDWFHRREEEIQRAVAAYREAVRHADAMDRGGAAALPAAAAAAPPAAAAGAAPAGAHAAVPGLPAPAGPRPRGPRPEVPRVRDVRDLSDAQILDMVEWIQSDGIRRTDDEILDELVRALGFQRRGARIVARLKQALDLWHRRRGR